MRALKGFYAAWMRFALENFIIDKKGQMSLGDTSPKQEFEPD